MSVIISIGAVVLIIVYIGTTLFIPLAPVIATSKQTTIEPVATPSLPWPAYGQGALYAEGYGLLSTYNAETPMPIASITKVITALTVLEQKPIQDSAQSPTITLSAADTALYDAYLAKDAVVAPARAGMTISEYDLLQIMLVASASNYAETLAVWAFGSVDAYLTAARKYLAANGLAHTTVADVAGFDNGSASTAEDLVRLGLLALKHPIVSQIVSKPSVTVPNVGTFQSTNLLVADGKAIGVKTGNTDAAGQCLLFAQKATLEGTQILLVGAQLGGSTRAQVAQDVSNVLTSAQSAFKNTLYAQAGKAYATYQSAWGATTTLVAPNDASGLTWQGHALTVSADAPAITPDQTTVTGAKLTLSSDKTAVATTSLELSQPLAPPSIWWRLTHPHKIWRVPQF